MRNYIQFNVEGVFPEPGGLLYVALSKNGLEKIVDRGDKQSDLVIVPVEEIRLHLLKLKNGIIGHLLSDTKPEDSYMANFEALVKIVRYVELSTSYKFPFKTRTSQAF